MRAQILYLPEGIRLDLGEPDLGHPEGLEIIQRHYRQSRKSGSRFSRHNPAFACLTHLGGTNPGLFIKKIRDEWWAVHYERGLCGSHRPPTPMSDKHKYRTEYWVRAAEVLASSGTIAGLFSLLGAHEVRVWPPLQFPG